MTEDMLKTYFYPLFHIAQSQLWRYTFKQFRWIVTYKLIYMYGTIHCAFLKGDWSFFAFLSLNVVNI